MSLYGWAAKWGIDPAAVADLRIRMGIDPDPTLAGSAICGEAIHGSSESAVQARERLFAAQEGWLLWRNNVGAMQDDTGRVVRYGLANESKKMNQKTKSSDLVGVRPVTITPNHLGMTLGQFVARETKPAGWQYTGTEREEAQLRFLNLVASKGGDACFVNGPPH